MKKNNNAKKRWLLLLLLILLLGGFCSFYFHKHPANKSVSTFPKPQLLSAASSAPAFSANTNRVITPAATVNPMPAVPHHQVHHQTHHQTKQKTTQQAAPPTVTMPSQPGKVQATVLSAPHALSTPVDVLEKTWWLAVGGAYNGLATPATNAIDMHERAPPTPDHYVYQPVNPAVSYDVSFGYEWRYSTRMWLPAQRVGVLYQYLPATTVNGQIQESLRRGYVANYDFSNQVSSNAAFLIYQLDLMDFHGLAPYIEAGIGAAYNQFSNYQVTPFPDVNPRDPLVIFANQVTWNFAYRAGAGLAYRFPFAKQAVTLSVGYSYMNLGSAQGGAAPAYPGVAAPEQDLSSNQINVRLRYRF